MYNNYPNGYGFNQAYNNYTPQVYPNVYQPQVSAINAPTSQPTTNKIYVNGIDDVRQKMLPVDGIGVFFDNDDRSIMYEKTVYKDGHFDVQVYDIVPHVNKPEPVKETPDYALRADLEGINKRITDIENTLHKTQEVANATDNK